MKNILNAFVAIVILFSSSSLLSQEQHWVDTVMATYPSDFETIESLVERIDYDFKTPNNKVRALYLWLARHIRYDQYGQVTKPASEWIVYYSQYDKERKKKALLKARLDDYFMQRQALCKGYSGLFTLGCELMGIKAESIHGFSKMQISDIDNSVRYKNHSWNAVWLNGHWNFIDVTWSAGYEDPTSGHWIPNLNDYFYKIPAAVFITSHYPIDPKWQLLKHPISEAQFFAEPIYYPAYFEQNYSLDQSQKGNLYVLGNTIRLEFRSLPEDTPLYYSFDGSARILPVNQITKNRNNNYELLINAKKGKYKQLTLYTEFTPILDFKIAAN